MPNQPSFGRWLKQRRKALDLTQESHGEPACCAADTIRRSEAEQLRPSCEVAERLIVSPRTVHAHPTSIYGKLGVDFRTAATPYAFEHHLV
jgi:DNA-binding XRE family transcriptional regulator